PSPAEPVFAYRADAPVGARLEVCDDGSTWRAVAADRWVHQVQSTTYSSSVDTSWTTIPSGSFSATVPAGRQLEVVLDIPRVRHPAGGGSSWAMFVAGAKIAGAYFSLSAGVEMHCPLTLRGVV